MSRNSSICISLPAEVLVRLDKYAGYRGVSRLIRVAIEDHLANLALQEAADNTWITEKRNNINANANE